MHSGSLRRDLLTEQLIPQVEKELQEERAKAEGEERLAKEAIEQKRQELQQIEAERQQEVHRCCHTQ